MSTTLPFPKVSPADAEPARKLWGELATRITTQRLHPCSGDEETAAESVYKLFDPVRELLVAHGKAEAFTQAALYLINQVLRRYTARWHRWMINERFRNELARRQFREELSSLRERLESFQELFRQLSAGTDPDPDTMRQCFGPTVNGGIAWEANDGSGLANLGGPVVAGIRNQVAFAQGALPDGIGAFASADDINAAEWGVIRERRRIFGRDAVDQKTKEPVNATALCLSGGGIRSATFCLGIVQELARRGMLPQFDYLSTVSGGGYFGSFLSSRLGTDGEALKAALGKSKLGRQRATPEKETLEREIREAFEPQTGGEESKAVRHLRNNSRYLLNGGAWGVVRIVGLLVSGILTNLLMFLPLALVAVLVMVGLGAVGYWGDAWEDVPPPTRIAAVQQRAGAAAERLDADPAKAGASEVNRPATGAAVERLQAGLDNSGATQARPGGVARNPEHTPAYWVMVVSGLALACVWLPLPLIKTLAHGRPPRSKRVQADAFWTTAAVLLALCSLGAVVLYELPALFYGYRKLHEWRPVLPTWIDGEKLIAKVLAAAPFIFGLLTARRAGAGKGGKVLAVLFTLSGPLLLLFVFLYAGYRVEVARYAHWGWVNTALLAAAAGLALWLGIFLRYNPDILTRRTGGKKPEGRLEEALAAFCTWGGLLFLAFLLALGLSHMILIPDPHWNWGLLVVTSGLLLWGWFFININTHGPHRYYRDRLCECYLFSTARIEQTGSIRRKVQNLIHGGTGSKHVPEEENGATEGEEQAIRPTLQQLPLEAISTSPAAPYHILNATANLPASQNLELRGRASDFFIFSRMYCGGPVCGYIRTKDLRKLDPHVDLGSAMAISGAAASSNMGAKTLEAYRFFLTLLNVRLGYWLRNPRTGPPSSPLYAPGPEFFFREMTGWMHERAGYLNLSDGGHIENLAAYEMLRRRCKFLVVVDGGQEPGMECADLILLQRYASIDLGIEIDFDITNLSLDDARRSRAYAILGKIRYEPERKAGGAIGWLLYIKLAVTGAEPAYVGDYRRQFPEFPHESTGEQIYSEAQFEAYRALGECAARSLFSRELLRRYRDGRTAQIVGNGGQHANRIAQLQMKRAELAIAALHEKRHQRGEEAEAFHRRCEEIDRLMAAFRDEEQLDRVAVNIDEWFTMLASSLLPDNDPAFATR